LTHIIEKNIKKSFFSDIVTSTDFHIKIVTLMQILTIFWATLGLFGLGALSRIL